MTSKLTRERLQEIAEDGFLKHGESKELARMALAAMDSEPVAWTWHYREQWHVTNDERRAEFVAKDGDVAVLPLYHHAQPAQISEPVLPLQDKDLQGVIDALEHPAGINAAGKQLVRLALVEIQERRKADNEPVAWTDEEELRDVNVAGIGYLFGIDREANKFADPRRQIMLYRHAQPAPEKYNIGDATMRHIFTPTGMTNVSDMQAVFDRVEAVLVGMEQPEPVVPDGYVMAPMRLTAENGAKGALSGEFSETRFVNCPECFGDDECETCDGSGKIEITVPVTWTTIKEIWAKGVEHFSATPREVKGE
ncbi:TPA: hypothetical protein ACN7N4_002254 [Klebsiella pneumoniae]|jgi:hypothetical protein|uniref:hypothetical protein n=1 Tax=Klebsiella pneumoniae TaxID=573 RepID=UPI0020747B51|nr:hypothetical protein [Klebsiella pneumoniae]MCM6150029.1 hypothetical protein [Klebsiella pneumoniae]MCY0509839.1 hypothetical protein [Klebsiella pneumoniae]MDG0356371.1 hypothetical protein [Klebsiella pneumoniae]GKI32756.1 hypothetical protein NUBL21973_16450 [Klebsiella pneumoniae]GKL37713.1 hypothetical protein NUBL21992_12030 [Klebsiella pneumoniae]